VLAGRPEIAGTRQAAGALVQDTFRRPFKFGGILCEQARLQRKTLAKERGGDIEFERLLGL